jgi:hypothetical protein
MGNAHAYPEKTGVIYQLWHKGAVNTNSVVRAAAYLSNTTPADGRTGNILSRVMKAWLILLL